MNLLVQAYLTSSDSPAKLSLVLSTLQSVITSLAASSSDASTQIPYHSLFKYLYQPLNILSPRQWDGTISFMIHCIRVDSRCQESITTALGVALVKHIMQQINKLPTDLSKAQVLSLIKGKELINILLLGTNGDGGGCLSYYDVIVSVCAC